MNAKLDNLLIGDDYPARIMGILNVSPESFYKGSVQSTTSKIKQAAEQMVLDGADIIDIGARSSATDIPIEEEIARICQAIEATRQVCDLPISADTFFGPVAKAAQAAGANILNDVSGLAHDSELAEAAPLFKGVILMANGFYTEAKGSTIEVVRQALEECLERAANTKLDLGAVVLDPGIGFFGSHSKNDWHNWDRTMIQNIHEWKKFNLPIVVSISRKSFIGHILERKDPNDRLYGSLGLTMFGLLEGVNVIRTHDVAAVHDICKMTCWLKQPDRP
jgi:dihydropteroate synthase